MRNNGPVTALKGFFMGAANVVPGVSGGTVALITGIYKELIDALNGLMERASWQMLLKGDFRGFWKRIHGPFLLWLGIGVLLSVFTLAKLMTYVLDFYPVQTWACFFGLILASAILMFRDIKGWGIREILFALAGIALGLAVSTLSPTQTPDNWFITFLCGAIAVCTMILPGVSGSFILVILGKYDYIMEAVASLDWPVLLVFALGCVAGLLAFAKLLHWLLARYEKPTMLVLLGFVLGSLVKVWPWANESAKALPDPHYGAAALWCLIGFALVLGVDRLSGRARNNGAE